MPDVIKYTANKKYCDLLYGILQEVSELNEDGCRYVKKEKINYSALGKKIGVTRQVASKRIKNLIDLGLIEFCENKNMYKMNYLDKETCSLVPYETLRKLNNTLSENCINIFLYLLKRFIANNKSAFMPTMSQLKGFIGIATTTTSNNLIITDILEVLRLLGLVEWQYWKDEENKTHIKVLNVTNMLPQLFC